MSKDKRQGWLKELSVGSSVIIKYYNYGTTYSYIREVERISPTGRIRVNDTNFDAQGRIISNNRGMSAKLEPLSIEDLQMYLDRNRKFKLISQIQGVNLTELSVAQLEEVKQLLDKLFSDN